MARSILDFCLPRECPACRTAYESDHSFCPDCEQELSGLEQSARCSWCAMPVTIPGAPCAQCLGNGLPLIEKVVCLGVLKDPLKSAIHRMKYEHRWPLAERLADRLLARADAQSLLQNVEVILPVPLHRQRQRERGYNQAEVIARRLCRVFNSPGREKMMRQLQKQVSKPLGVFADAETTAVRDDAKRFRKPFSWWMHVRQAEDHAEIDDDLPIDPRPSGLGYQKLSVVRAADRIRPTETQTHLHSRAQRIENLKTAFALTNPSCIQGKHVLLVDDVLTTGATLLSLARALKPAKPASLSAIVLAVADPKGRAFEVI